MDMIKVSANSRTSAVAGAIAGVVREHHRAEVQAIGAGAVNQAVKALVVLRKGSAPTAEALIEHCRTLIARYKCPRSVDFVDELPRLATGKLDKPTMRARYRS